MKKRLKSKREKSSQPRSKIVAAAAEEPDSASAEFSPPINTTEDLYRRDKIAEAGTATITAIDSPSTSCSSRDVDLSAPDFLQPSERNAGTFAVIKFERDKGNIHFRLRADIDPSWMIQQHRARRAAIEAVAEAERKLAQVAEFKRKSRANQPDRRRYKIPATAVKSGDEQQVQPPSEEPLKRPKSEVKLIRAVPKFAQGGPSVKTLKKAEKADRKISKVKEKMVKRLQRKTTAPEKSSTTPGKSSQKKSPIVAPQKKTQAKSKALSLAHAKKATVTKVKAASLRSPRVVAKKVKIAAKNTTQAKKQTVVVAKKKILKKLSPKKTEQKRKEREKPKIVAVVMKQKIKNQSQSSAAIEKKEKKQPIRSKSPEPATEKKKVLNVKENLKPEKETPKVKKFQEAQNVKENLKPVKEKTEKVEKIQEGLNLEKKTNKKETAAKTGQKIHTKAPIIVENVVIEEKAKVENIEMEESQNEIAVKEENPETRSSSIEIPSKENVSKIDTIEEKTPTATPISEESPSKENTFEIDIVSPQKEFAVEDVTTIDQQSPPATMEEDSEMKNSKSSEDVISLNNSQEILVADMSNSNSDEENHKIGPRYSGAEMETIKSEAEEFRESIVQEEKHVAHQSVSYQEDFSSPSHKYSYQEYPNYDDDSPIDESERNSVTMAPLTDDEIEMIKEKVEAKKKKLKQVKLAEYNNMYHEERSDWENFEVDEDEIDISEELMEILFLRRLSQRASLSPVEETHPELEQEASKDKKEVKKPGLLKKKVSKSPTLKSNATPEEEPGQFKLCQTCGWMVCRFENCLPQEQKVSQI